MSAPVRIRQAATAALLRDGESGLEVLLLRRHAGHVFGANAYVFPGGAVDAADSGAAFAARSASGLDYANACFESELDDDSAVQANAVAYWTAAIRECFEEAGVLVACDCGHIESDRVLSARTALNAGTRHWADVISDLDLRFRLDDLVYFAHWTTPAGMPKRYSTRFFAARAPAEQSVLCDGMETTRAWWARPADAIAAHEAGEIHMMVPTRSTLERLRDHADTDTALADLGRRVHKGP